VSKPDPIEAALDAIGELRAVSSPDEALTQLRTQLKNRSNLVVAKAAKVAGELRLTGLTPDLIAAFERLWVNPAKLDKRCAATTEIVNVLYEFDYTEPEVYLRGIRHIQKEASFGPPVDVAAKLRGMCAQGLLRTRSADAMALVVNLLVDPEPPARLGAVRALASNGGEAGVLLLRLKTLIGDGDPEIVSECFMGLVAAAPEQSVPFVATYMDAEDEVIAEAAIWALGQSRQIAALAALKEKWERTVGRPLRKVLIAALAASRLEEAIDYLVSQLRSADERTADDILTALSNYAGGESVKQSVAAAVQERTEPAITKLFRQHFHFEEK
jgi:HEAT repeat protein